MGRLIDAEKLKECILEDGRVTIDEGILECDNVHKILVYLLEKVEAEVIRQIDLQPTAYDVEAVLKELREREELYMFPDDDDYTCGQYDAMREAIEIVRRGGVKSE